jgi:hypothetical protein
MNIFGSEDGEIQKALFILSVKYIAAIIYSKLKIPNLKSLEYAALGLRVEDQKHLFSMATTTFIALSIMSITEYFLIIIVLGASFMIIKYNQKTYWMPLIVFVLNFTFLLIKYQNFNLDMFE